MPLHHFSCQVPKDKLENVVSFLTESLGHMGFREMLRPVPHAVGMGETRPYLWIVAADTGDQELKGWEARLRNTHIAFTAESIGQVKAFHAAALEAGGMDNGAPGFREHYQPGYYGAFARDPHCGINFEVVHNTIPAVGT